MQRRRSFLKKMFFTVGGLTGMGFVSKGEIDVQDEIAHGDIVTSQEVPLYSYYAKYKKLIFMAAVGAHDAPFTIKHHAEAVLDLLEKRLVDAGSSMSKVLMVHVYLTTMADYQGLNEVYRGRFGSKPPGRITVAVGKDNLPENALLLMDCIAYK